MNLKEYNLNDISIVNLKDWLNEDTFDSNTNSDSDSHWNQLKQLYLICSAAWNQLFMQYWINSVIYGIDHLFNPVFFFYLTNSI